MYLIQISVQQGQTNLAQQFGLRTQSTIGGLRHAHSTHASTLFSRWPRCSCMPLYVHCICASTDSSDRPASSGTTSSVFSAVRAGVWSEVVICEFLQSTTYVEICSNKLSQWRIRISAKSLNNYWILIVTKNNTDIQYLYQTNFNATFFNSPTKVQLLLIWLLEYFVFDRNYVKKNYQIKNKK